MGLQLFHITEFAQSRLTPAAQREARHPATLVLLASVWLAAAGNLPLWHALAQGSLGGGRLLWLGLCFGLVSAAALGALLSALNWSGLLKAAITALLWLCALNTVLLWSGQEALRLDATPLPGQAVATQLRAVPLWLSVGVFGLLALAPTLWLWPLRLRRIALRQRLPQNLLLLALFAALLALAWLGAQPALWPLLQEQPHWLALLSPFNTLLSLRP